MSKSIITNGFKFLRRLDKERRDSQGEVRLLENNEDNTDRENHQQRVVTSRFLLPLTTFLFLLLLIFSLSCSDTPIQIIETKPVLIPLPDTVLPYDIQFLDTLNGWLAALIPVGQSATGGGGIYRTSDGGVTWYQSCTVDSAPLYNLSFVDKEYGWACGNRGVIINTTNGGKNWNKYDTRALLDYEDTLYFLMGIQFLNRLEGWIGGSKKTGIPDCGGYALVLHTTDGGRNWRKSFSGSGGHVRNIHFLPNGSGWAVGGGNFADCDPFIIHTTDYGETWGQQYYPTYLQLAYSVAFYNQQYGFIGGNVGIIRTTNAGTRWDTIGIAIAPVLDIAVVNDSTVFAMGKKGIFQSINKGIRWNKQFDMGGGTLKCISFINDTTGWVAGNLSYPTGFVIYRYRNNFWSKIK